MYISIAEFYNLAVYINLNCMTLSRGMETKLLDAALGFADSEEDFFIFEFSGDQAIRLGSSRSFGNEEV